MLFLHHIVYRRCEVAIEVPCVVGTGLHYALQYPFQEFHKGRNLRMSPIYPRLREVGAVFGQVMGYERPTYFDYDNGSYKHLILPSL